MQPSQTAPLSQPRVMFIIYGSFAVACFIYAAIIFYLPARESAAESPALPHFVWWALAAMQAPIAVVVGIVKKVTKTGDAVKYLGLVQTRMILQAACLEAMAIYGLVGYLLGLPRMHALALCAMAAISLLTLLPGLIANMETYGRMVRGEVDPNARRLGGR